MKKTIMMLSLLGCTIALAACPGGTDVNVAGELAGITSCNTANMACNDVMVNTMCDPANCGGCGIKCATGMICRLGTCVGTTAPTCAALCGVGMVCKQNASGAFQCLPSACVPACVRGSVCNESTAKCECPSGSHYCGVTDSCSPDGTACPNTNGGCAQGQTVCAGACVNTQTDVNNCNACGFKCAAGQSCVGGACVNTGGGTGVGVQCGATGMICPPNWTCGTGGICQPPVNGTILSCNSSGAWLLPPTNTGDWFIGADKQAEGRYSSTGQPIGGSAFGSAWGRPADGLYHPGLKCLDRCGRTIDAKVVTNGTTTRYAVDPNGNVVCGQDGQPSNLL